MSKGKVGVVVALVGILGILLVAGLGIFFYATNWYNGTVTLEEGVSEQWSNVENAYQLRADKTQNLVAIVKGAADFEQETLTQVVEARSKATSVNIDANDLSPEKIQAFQEAQSQFSGALSRLLVTIERYPELKATEAFRDFQAQYEGMENRIGVERRKYNQSAREFNTRIKRFPGNFLAGWFSFEEKGYF
ncbi:MAG: LemA family protein, partial [Flavobacteriales bacterium]|nr:LemA family protein [Flavobacteriales bacterium]